MRRVRLASDALCSAMWRREAVLEARATMRCVWMLGVLTIAESVQSTDVQQHSGRC